MHKFQQKVFFCDKRKKVILHTDLLIKDAFCVLPTPNSRLVVEQADVAIKDGTIVQIGSPLNVTASEVINAKGLHLLPGIIDTHVHLREPGLTHKEDFYSGTASAVLGGVTTVFDMPNTSPPTTSQEALTHKLQLASGRAFCNYAFFIGATQDNIDHLHLLERATGSAGIKVFLGSSTGSLLVDDADDLNKIMRHSSRRLVCHCEDEARLSSRKQMAIDGKNAIFHPVWRDVETALRATRKVVALAAELQREVHVLHVTSSDEIKFLAQNKSWASAECCPHYLTFNAPDCYHELGNLAQVNPPIREKIHQEALWFGINNNIIDVISSDHAPHTKEEKMKVYPSSPSGMPGTQTLLPVMLNHVNQGRLTLTRLVELTSTNPARLFRLLNKGSIATGFDADLTLIDLNLKKRLALDEMAIKCGWTAYEGMHVTGYPITTLVGGIVTVRDQQLVAAQPVGQVVQFHL